MTEILGGTCSLGRFKSIAIFGWAALRSSKNLYNLLVHVPTQRMCSQIMSSCSGQLLMVNGCHS